nr:hypothetical protein [Calditrichia bacterium]
MPLRQDFILRLIEQLGKAFREIAAMLQLGEASAARELLEEVTLGQSGLPLPVLEALSIEELLRLLDKNG